MDLSPATSKRFRVGVCVCMLVLGCWSLAWAERNYLTDCPLKKGDSLDVVKKFYGVSREPTAESRPLPTSPHFFYRLPQYGVWVYFDSGKKVLFLRFEQPFAGKIDGVCIGDAKKDVLKLKGEPARQSQGLPDAEALTYRKKRELEIIENLPDPASKELVRAAFKECEQIRSRPVPYNNAWLYKAPGRALLRYEFGSLSDKVQTILSDRGTDPSGTERVAAFTASHQ
ncbi:MAG: hypothetical protein AB1646_09835 [Thermodesulfobacteriota bacterium]